LYVPSIGLIVGGDAVYNGIHPYLGETDTQSRLEWISTLDKLEALKSKAVVAGHKVPENDDDPPIIGETRALRPTVPLPTIARKAAFAFFVFRFCRKVR
jgi:glyoxylase-like metal-dependent hydrolase (beta-lactamase superfamily II)